MRFAVIGDIHGNKYALENVLKDIDSKNIDFIISTGDLVGYMPYPNEVIELIRKNKVIVVQGNHDKIIAESKKISTNEIEKMTDEDIQKKASRAFTNWVLTDENRNYLKNLTTKLSLEVDGVKVVVVHGSPMAIDEYLYEDKEKLSKLTEVINEDVIICGHTHVPYSLAVKNKTFINAGSVGKPKHGDYHSTYVIVEIKDGVVCSSIEKVNYDVELMIRNIKNNRMISNELITMLQEGY